MQTTKLNLDLLNKLLKDNKNAIRQALELFVETTIEDMRALSHRIEERKFPEAAKLAHSLKSRFVYLGNEEASYNVKLLEGLLKDGRENTFGEIETLFRNLNSLIHFCISEINDQIKVMNS